VMALLDAHFPRWFSCSSICRTGAALRHPTNMNVSLDPAPQVMCQFYILQQLPALVSHGWACRAAPCHRRCVCQRHSALVKWSIDSNKLSSGGDSDLQGPCRVGQGSWQQPGSPNHEARKRSRRRLFLLKS
jgi:hypothetical protein